MLGLTDLPPEAVESLNKPAMVWWKRGAWSGFVQPHHSKVPTVIYIKFFKGNGI